MTIIKCHRPIQPGKCRLEQAIVEIQKWIAGAIVNQGFNFPAGITAEISDSPTIETFNSHALARFGAADQRIVWVIMVWAACVVVFDQRDRGHLKHCQPFPFGRLDHIAAVVDAMRQRSQSATLILPLGIEQVDHILRRQPLINCACLVTKCVFLCLATWVINDAVLKRAASVLFAIAKSFWGCDSVTRNALVLRESGCGFCQQNENLPVNINRGRPPKKVGLKVMHSTPGITDPVKHISEEIGCRSTECIISSFINRNKCATDCIHATLIDRILDWAEIKVNPPGM